MSVRGLHHVGLAVTDLDQAIATWERLVRRADDLLELLELAGRAGDVLGCPTIEELVFERPAVLPHDLLRVRRQALPDVPASPQQHGHPDNEADHGSPFQTRR